MPALVSIDDNCHTEIYLAGEFTIYMEITHKLTGISVQGKGNLLEDSLLEDPRPLGEKLFERLTALVGQQERKMIR